MSQSVKNRKIIERGSVLVSIFGSDKFGGCYVTIGDCMITFATRFIHLSRRQWWGAAFRDRDPTTSQHYRTK